MAISVSLVHLESDYRELLSILQLNLPDLSHDQRFRWLYYANPDGPPWCWFAREGSTRRIVGVTSLFPRSMWIGEKVRMCGQVGDFGISASHRSLGPALLLQRATFQPVDQGTLAFCYDCPPHEAGMAMFRRIKIAPNCTVDRYALPLRVDRYMRARLGAASVFPARIGNVLLRTCRRMHVPKGLDISEHIGAFGEEFSELDAAVKTAQVIRSRRTAIHLNWRYRSDPLQQYQILTARRKGELVAFVVLSVRNEDITVVDLFGLELPEIAVALLEAVGHRYRMSYQSVETFLSSGHELIGPVLKMRFRRRSEAARVVAYAKSGTDTCAFLQGRPRWAFSQADIRA
jgi:hypothetical protein